MSRISLAMAAGLAVAAGARADVMISHAGPTSLGAGQSVVLFSGNLSGTATTFDWSFTYGEPVLDSSWASDMMITITAANGNSIDIGGYPGPGDLTPSYDGPGSNAPGVYAQGAPLNLGAFNLSNLLAVIGSLLVLGFSLQNAVERAAGGEHVC